jgi:hypothetical protein
MMSSYQKKDHLYDHGYVVVVFSLYGSCFVRMLSDLKKNSEDVVIQKYV